MDEQVKPCSDRVGPHWESRKEDLDALLDPDEAEPETLKALGQDPEDPTLAEYGLAFDYVPAGTYDDQGDGYFRYQLSSGGPSDEIRFYVSLDLRMYRAEYWFLDWFDGAHLDVTEDPTALAVWEWFQESGAVRTAYDQQ